MIHTEMLPYSPTSLPSTVPFHAVSPWYAVHVRHNFEFKVFERLAAFDVESFLPRYTSTRQWNDRKVRIELPLFPGYLFVRLDWRQKLRVVSHPGVISMVGGPEASIDDGTISHLRKAVTMQTATPYDLPDVQPGDRVRVIAGPFLGMEGTLDRRKADCRVVVTVQSLARCFVLEVRRDDIELV